MNVGSVSSAFVAGNRNCSVANIFVDSGSVLRNSANLAAAIGFFVAVMTADVEPPQLPDTLACRRPTAAAARPATCPRCRLALPDRKTGPQAAVEPGGVLALVERLVPLVGEVRVGGDDALLDQPAPVRRRASWTSRR